MMNFENTGRDLGLSTDKLDKNKESAMLPQERINFLRNELKEAGNKMIALADKFNILTEEDYTKVSNAPLLREISDKLAAAEKDQEVIKEKISVALDEMKILENGSRERKDEVENNEVIRN